MNPLESNDKPMVPHGDSIPPAKDTPSEKSSVPPKSKDSKTDKIARLIKPAGAGDSTQSKVKGKRPSALSRGWQGLKLPAFFKRSSAPPSSPSSRSASTPSSSSSSSPASSPASRSSFSLEATSKSDSLSASDKESDKESDNPSSVSMADFLSLSPSEWGKSPVSAGAGVRSPSRVSGEAEGEKDPVDRLGDLMRGIKITDKKVPLADSKGKQIEGGINEQFHKDVMRSTISLDGMKRWDASVGSAQEKADRLVELCQSLIEDFGKTGFANLSLLLNQAVLADVTGYVLKSSVPNIARCDSWSFDISKKEGMVTITVQANYAIKDSVKGLFIGNRAMTREITLTEDELKKNFIGSEAIPRLKVSDQYETLSRPTEDQERFNERMSG